MTTGEEVGGTYKLQNRLTVDLSFLYCLAIIGDYLMGTMVPVANPPSMNASISNISNLSIILCDHFFVPNLPVSLPDCLVNSIHL